MHNMTWLQREPAELDCNRRKQWKTDIFRQLAFRNSKAMEKILFGLALILVAAEAQATTTEPSLVLCPRQYCEPCQYGFKLDWNGCETCECLPSPCLNASCPAGTECHVSRWRDCGEEVPCRHFEAECRPVTTPSHAPPREQHTTPVYHGGIPTDENGCRPVLCRMYCPFGWKRDEQGCGICACDMEPCESLNCAEGSACEPHRVCPDDGPCHNVARCSPLIGRLRTVPTPTTPAPRPGMACPLYQCYMFCEYGFKKNEHGCEICDCNTSPCASKVCDEGLTCKVSESVCGEDNHQCHVGSCQLKPLCLAEQERAGQRLLGAGGRGHHMPGLPSLGSRMVRSVQHVLTSVPPPSCSEDGSFLPTQCNHVTGECWCVDDRGLEVQGTRKNLREEGAEALNCPENRTTSLTGMVKLNHDLDDVQTHIDNLRELAEQKVSEWMVVAREYVVIVEMTPADIHILQMVFVVRTDENAVHDLATSSVHLQHQAFQESLQMTYQGHTITPQSHSLNVQHRYMPALPPVGVRDGPTDFYHQHQAVLVSCMVGIVFFLVVVAALVKLVAARRKMGNAEVNEAMVEDEIPRYKKNLALGKTFSMSTGDDEKKVVLSDAEDMARDVVA